MRYANPAWVKHSYEDALAGETILSDKAICTKALCYKLAANGKIYKVTNMGGGVSAISTVLDTCPCCKRKL